MFLAVNAIKIQNFIYSFNNYYEHLLYATYLFLHWRFSSKYNKVPTLRELNYFVFCKFGFLFIVFVYREARLCIHIPFGREAVGITCFIYLKYLRAFYAWQQRKNYAKQKKRNKSVFWLLKSLQSS